MLLGDRAVLPLFRRHRRVGIAHRLQFTLHPHAADADLCDAVTFPQPSHRLAQCAIERLALAVVQRAVLQHGAVPEARHVGLGDRRRQRIVLRPVAARLHDQRRAGGSGEMPHIGQPVGQRLIWNVTPWYSCTDAFSVSRAHTNRNTALVRRNSACVP